MQNVLEQDPDFWCWFDKTQFSYHCVYPIHAKMFSILMLLHFSQIAQRVCTLVLFHCYYYHIFRSISHTFYQEICFKFLTCDLYCGCEKRGALPSISRMRVPACNAYGSLGATGGSMASRRCSYTAAFKVKLVNTLKDTEIVVRDPPRAACRSVANVCII